MKLSDSELAERVAKLWPHRAHEAAVPELLCRSGLHNWRRLELSELGPGKDILHCCRCAKVKIDGVVYET